MLPRHAPTVPKVIALFAILCVHLDADTVEPPSPPPEPKRPVVDVKIPLVSIATMRGEAFILPDEIKIPPRGIVRIKGTFHTGSRAGGELVVAEAKVPSKNGHMSLLSNGAKGVRMVENTECEFELLMHFPKDIRPGIVEIRLRGGYLATASFRPAP